jgi:hypothetical protein
MGGRDRGEEGRERVRKSEKEREDGRERERETKREKNREKREREKKAFTDHLTQIAQCVPLGLHHIVRGGYGDV